MFDAPFEVVRCSWPRPVVQENGCWVSEPEWDAPPLPYLPRPRWDMLENRPCLLIDWRETFRAGVHHPPNAVCGDLCGFHVVFEIRVRGDGLLSFWDDDGCVIRQEGCIVHNDRTSHGLRRRTLNVSAGTLLCVAQWQFVNDWIWAASFHADLDRGACEAMVLRYRSVVEARMSQPNGPPLRVFSEGKYAVRMVLAIYSMVINGYSPSRIELFGEHQWDGSTRAFLKEALPDAQVHSTDALLRLWTEMGGAPLAELAQQHWFAMKACVALLSGGDEFCMMDDDVFVLDSVGDALERFAECDAVFSPDTNHGAAYLSIWGKIFGNSASSGNGLATGRMNTGLMWLRPLRDAASVARAMVLGRNAVGIGAWAWEQGLLANVYAHSKVHQLPSTRYLLPLWEGLPGGVLGYDYRANPCGFASIHFAGVWNKPSDSAAAWLAPEILERGRE